MKICLPIVVFVLVLFSLQTIVGSEPNMPANQKKLPAFFNSAQELNDFLKQQKLPADVEVASTKSGSYCFVFAYPYSGMDTTDLYCYVKEGDMLGLYLTATLFRTPPKKAKVSVDGDFVDVICKEKLVLKISQPPPRDSK